MSKPLPKGLPQSLVLDAETDVSNIGDEAVGNFAGNQYCEANKIVSIGFYCTQTKLYKKFYLASRADEQSLGRYLETNLPLVDMLVGQNIRFDLIYLLRQYPEVLKNHLARLMIWDTQYAEYTLSGQVDTQMPLDQLSDRYGGTQKDDKIKEYWNAGIQTRDIPADELLEYMKYDVLNTARIFVRQFAKISSLGMMACVSSDHAAMKATLLMGLNGMHFDKWGAMEKGEEVEKECLTVAADVLELIQSLPVWCDLDPTQINVASPTTQSCVFFGGILKVTERQQCVDDDGELITYKSGQKVGLPKMKNVVAEVVIPGIFSTDITCRTKRGNSVVYGVDEKVLQAIISQPKGIVKADACRLTGRAIAENLLLMRGLAKDYGTYYKGYSDLVWPDMKLRPSLHHARTITSRLSCSEPNLQNTSNAGD